MTPDSPCEPVLPINPWGPVSPVIPWIPVSPCGPVSPVAPVSPISPCGPVAPVVAATPVALIWSTTPVEALRTIPRLEVTPVSAMIVSLLISDVPVRRCTRHSELAVEARWLAFAVKLNDDIIIIPAWGDVCVTIVDSPLSDARIRVGVGSDCFLNKSGSIRR